jgi:tetratricopeptide (TPR) repeat protein
MKKFALYTGAIILLLLAGCSGGRYLELTRTCESEFEKGNYGESLSLAEQLIGEVESKGKTAPGETYALAGFSADALGQHDKSLEYLTKAEKLQYSSERLYLSLAGNYRHIDNLSKEITALGSYLEKYPDGSEITAVRERLFQTCLESENTELAGELWPRLDSASRRKTGVLETWLNLNLMMENDATCDSLADVILEKDPENESAMKWVAETSFWRAENEYLAQMKAYKANRTHKQYAILLKAFKQVNADFRKSRDYFEKLYRLHPKPEYAGYLGKIYTRLEDEQKARYYKKLARQG